MNTVAPLLPVLLNRQLCDTAGSEVVDSHLQHDLQAGKGGVDHGGQIVHAEQQDQK